MRYVVIDTPSLAPSSFVRLTGEPVYKSSPLDAFITDTVFAEDDKPITVFTTDVALFFNQQRISQDMVPLLNQMLSNVRNSSDLSDKYSHLSDDELLSCIKSRYIQAPCEIQDWTNYLMSELESLAAKTFESSPDVEPSPNVVPLSE